MRKFRFKFETLERVRKSEEEQAMRLLGIAQRAYQSTLDSKETLLSQLRISLERRERIEGSEIPGSAFQIETDFITGVKHRIVQIDQAILRAKKAVEKALRGYVAARRKTRMIEVLRERAMVEYKRELQKVETKNLNDLYLMRARLEKEWV